ncbi:hypothetical protein R3I94_009365 [Phoxinus phoxinus]
MRCLLGGYRRPVHRRSDESYLGWKLVDTPQRLRKFGVPRGLPCWMTRNWENESDSWLLMPSVENVSPNVHPAVIMTAHNLTTSQQLHCHV